MWDTTCEEDIKEREMKIATIGFKRDYPPLFVPTGFIWSDGSRHALCLECLHFGKMYGKAPKGSPFIWGDLMARGGHTEFLQRVYHHCGFITTTDGSDTNGVPIYQVVLESIPIKYITKGEVWITIHEREES